MNSEKELYDYLYSQIKNHYGVSGLMGNLKAESGLNPMNLQNNYERRLNYNDKSYTEAVDNGSYSNFVKDSAGYGLAQWTYYTRKQKLLNFAKSNNTSIGDMKMQADYLLLELKTSYPTVLNTLKKSKSVLEASNIVLTKFESPADQGKSVQDYRCKLGTEIYNKYNKSTATNNKKDESKIVAGKLLKLFMVPCFSNSTIKTAKSNKTGLFYLWSNEVVNGRVKITNAKSRVGVQGQVTGWINVSDL